MKDKLKPTGHVITVQQILFVIGVVTVMLKCANVIDWDWWVVTLPIWICPLLWFLAVVAMLSFAAALWVITCILIFAEKLITCTLVFAEKLYYIIKKK